MLDHAQGSTAHSGWAPLRMACSWMLYAPCWALGLGDERHCCMRQPPWFELTCHALAGKTTTTALQPNAVANRVLSATVAGAAAHAVGPRASWWDILLLQCRITRESALTYVLACTATIASSAACVKLR